MKKVMIVVMCIIILFINTSCYSSNKNTTNNTPTASTLPSITSSPTPEATLEPEETYPALREDFLYKENLSQVDNLSYRIEINKYITILISELEQIKTLTTKNAEQYKKDILKKIEELQELDLKYLNNYTTILEKEKAERQEILTIKNNVGLKDNAYIEYIGNFKLTAYCPCYECSGGWGTTTSTGTKARPNYTIAVDPKVIPYGSKIIINNTIYTAEDCGSAVKNNVIDIYFNTHGEVDQFGVKYDVKIYMIK